MIEVLIFRIDQFSFWAGFIAGILFAWLLAQASKFVPIVARALRNQIQSLRESLTTGTENRMRQDVLVWAQNQHLAASLFSMDEIAIQPRLLGKPIFLSDDDDSGSEVTATIPYMPDWPELAAAYGAATITLPVALQGGVNLLIVGQPGTGKTVALAHLASQIARREPAVGELASLFPLFLPAAALQDRCPASTPGPSEWYAAEWGDWPIRCQMPGCARGLLWGRLPRTVRNNSRARRQSQSPREHSCSARSW